MVIRSVCNHCALRHITHPTQNLPPYAFSPTNIFAQHSLSLSFHFHFLPSICLLVLLSPRTCSPILSIKSKSLWRGVRSDAQLSCTETRFQSAKHPMLSVTMAYKAISCKKNQRERSRKPKSLILLCKFNFRAQKWNGILWMPLGESSHPGGSE